MVTKNNCNFIFNGETMEKLKIIDFLTLKKIDIELKDFNILIGRQSSGKSLIAKLIYFFRSDLPDAFFSTATRESNGKNNSYAFKTELYKKLRVAFYESFNQETIGNRNFEIEYIHNDYNVNIRSIDGKLKFLISDSFKVEYHKLRSAYIDFMGTENEVPELFKSDVNYFRNAYFSRRINRNYHASILFSPSLFVPAGRGFFSLLEQNIFSFLSVNSTIDKFISQFGIFYRNAKRLHSRYTEPGKSTNVDRDIKYYMGKVEDIIGGIFKVVDGKDTIYQTNGITIDLSRASSGQQEISPLLISIFSILTIRQFRTIGGTLFIEEPEAHIFPKTQLDVLYLLSFIHNRRKLKTVITTHSPYILSSFNNLILAYRAYQYSSDEGKIAISKIIDRSLFINPDNAAAYAINDDGLSVNIIDKDSGLIGSNYLDSISDKISSDFEKITDIYS